MANPIQLLKFPRIHTCNSCSHILVKQSYGSAWACRLGEIQSCQVPYEKEKLILWIPLWGQPHKIMTRTVTVCWGLPHISVHEGSPKPYPICVTDFYFSAALNLTQDNHLLSTLAVSDFLLKEKNSSEKVLLFSTDGVFPRYSTISLLSDPLATEEVKKRTRDKWHDE